MTTEEQAEAIVEKYRSILPFKLAPNYAIKCATQCAIIEVQAIISSNPHSNPLNTNPIYSTMQYWMDILNHLKQI